MYISIFIPYIFLETRRKMKNAVKTTKFRVDRRVRYLTCMFHTVIATGK